MKSQAERLILIDSLRGVASVWVMFFHFYWALKGANEKLIIEPFHTLLAIGDQGVFIFFVLSGFVISLAVKTEALSWSYIGRFLARRSVRLDIPYWLVIIITGLSVVMLVKVDLSAIAPPTYWEYIVNMLYLDNLTHVESIVSVGWTLQYEIQFYLFYVFMLFVVVKGFNINSTIQFAILMITFVISWLYWFSWFPLSVKGLFLDYWMYFLLGVFAQYVVIQGRPSYVFFIPLFFVAIHFALFQNLSTLIASLTALLLFIAGRRHAYNRWLNIKILVFLGGISYSLYLIHPFLGNRILRFFSKDTLSVPFAWFLFTVVCCISVLAAFIFFKIVEKPSIKLSKQIKV